MKVSQICLLNKADQYCEIERLRIGVNLPSLDNEPHLKKVIQLIMFGYLKENLYATLLDFLHDTAIYKNTGEGKCEQR